MSQKIVKWSRPTAYINFIVYFIIALAVYLLFANAPGIYNSQWVYITNFMVVVYSLWNLLAYENKSYSAHKIFHIFIFFFMGIAPLMQYKLGTETVGGYKIKEEYYIITNLIVFSVLFHLIYSIG